MSKYTPLWKKIKQLNQSHYQMTYDEIKEILGFSIDHSFLNYKNELEKYGYQVEKISLKEKIIIFKKI